MAADFDDPVFDEDFVRSAVFTEPSARERARPPGGASGGGPAGPPGGPRAAASAAAAAGRRVIAWPCSS